MDCQTYVCCGYMPWITTRWSDYRERAIMDTKHEPVVLRPAGRPGSGDEGLPLRPEPIPWTTR
jgi:hypothetical protein